MRLIDADNLIEKLKSYAECDWNKSLYTMLPSVVDDCVEFVVEQRTACDIGKVVEKLEELKMRYFLTIANTGDEKSDFAYDNVGNALDKAIEIVKQDGVDDDVCEWNAGKSNDEWQPNCEPNSTYNVFGVAWFRKCPYCGKKIKVVE